VFGSGGPNFEFVASTSTAQAALRSNTGEKKTQEEEIKKGRIASASAALH
jgi:hypothetical protein